MGMMESVPRLSAEMSSRKLQVLAFIERYYRAHRQGPSLGEISSAIGIARQSACFHVKTLTREGRLLRTPGVARSIRPLSAHEEAVRQLEACGYALTNSELPPRFDLDHDPGHGEESEEGESSAPSGERRTA